MVPGSRPYDRVRTGRFRMESAGSVPGLVQNPVLQIFLKNQTGQPCEPVGPAGFAGSGPVPITLG